MPLQTCWELAQKWYTGRMALNWQRPGLEKARGIFNSLGLTGSFWDLSRDG